MISKVQDIFYPRVCALCNKTVNGEELICKVCSSRLIYAKENVCEKCGKILISRDEIYCKLCESYERNFIKGTSALYYNDVIRKSLSDFKYHNKRENVSFYSFILNERIRKVYGGIVFDVIVPIPVYKGRLIKRGYNQAEVLAKSLSELTGIKMEKDILIRNKRTVSQKELSKKDRILNLLKAFAYNSESKYDLKGKRVLLVDDIYTTGATMDAASMILKDNGAREVFFATVATGKGL